MRHGPDNRLSTLVHRYVLYPNVLLTSASVSLESLHLHREGELIECALRAILLRYVVHMSKPPRERHGGQRTGAVIGGNRW
jgi:hypothetical protein